MPINEIFPRPTVKQVIFQIRFPNLFFLESKIGDLQMAVMEKFPESSLMFRRPILFADLGPNVKIESLSPPPDSDQGTKIWQFKSALGYQLNVTTNSIAIVSTLHKTYKNPSSENRFRDIIEHVLKSFFTLAKIPMVSRIGLRYQDECPILSKTSAAFFDYYDSVLPLDRFKLEDASEMQFITVVKRGAHSLRYVEELKQVENEWKLLLDFDGFAADIKSEECLETTDKLHELIMSEYETTIKQPVIEYMRQGATNG
jgi:uncharacterized protein (TIGR04255 family)